MKNDFKIRFKPKFGNSTHARIFDMLGKFEKKLNVYKKKVSESKDIDKLEEELRHDHLEITRLIEWAETNEK